MALCTLFYLIDNINIPIISTGKQKLKDGFAGFTIKSYEQAEERQNSDQFVLLPFTDYKKKVSDKFRENSNEYLIVLMYDEVTCKDKFTLTIVQSNTEVINDDTIYLFLPVDSRVNATIVIINIRLTKHMEVSRRSF